MQIIKYESGISKSDFCKSLPPMPCGCVAALGFFDGVHLAHRALLAFASDAAKERHLPLLVFTFSTDGVIKKDAKRIYGDKEKASLISECGADYMLLCDFSAVRDMDKKSFVFDFLKGVLGVKVAVCGFNFRFGKDASGNSYDLSHLMKESGGECIVMPEYKLIGESVSSTDVRALINSADMRGAARLLGKPFFISGSVGRGLGIGKKMGIPTVNIPLQKDKISPPHGVFSTLAHINGRFYRALTNVGTCPTFGEREAHTETFILDFDGDVYDQDISIYFIDFLREEKKFSGENELIMQINIDKSRADELIKELKWQEIGLNLQ